MNIESDFYEDGTELVQAGSATPSISTTVKLVIMVGSLGLASIVGVYVHPHLLPVATKWAPELWRAAQAWMTAPILFLLLNVVVGTLYVSSNMLSKRGVPPGESGGGSAAPATTSDDRKMLSDEKSSRVAPAPEPRKPAAATGMRARFEKSRTLSRLVRSKSEQIPPISVTPETSSGRLKKAGTFEPTPRSRKSVVVVADPPEDDAPQGGHEEVDKKAEAFISRFYQKVKLQRLDSLLRQQQQQQGRQ